MKKFLLFWTVPAVIAFFLVINIFDNTLYRIIFFVLFYLLVMVIRFLIFRLGPKKKVDSTLKKQLVSDLLKKRGIDASNISQKEIDNTPENVIVWLTVTTKEYQQNGMFLANIIDKIEKESKWKSQKNEKEYYKIMGSIGGVASAGSAMYSYIVYRTNLECPDILSEEQITEAINYVLSKVDIL
jgi:hypothetical protein